MTKNKQFEDLMYEAGLTAQGCWDSFDAYDKEAVERFGVLIVKKCLEKTDAITTDVSFSSKEQLGAEWAAYAIAKHFGVE